jgi:hypothetical protein
VFCVETCFRAVVVVSWLSVVSIVAAQPGSPLKTIDKGPMSAIEAPRQVVVRSADDWEALWRAHGRGRVMPAVDFSQQMVLGVFLGSRPTAGYGVEIVSADVNDGTLVVRYRETRPRSDSITAQVITSPFHLVAVPKTDGEVKFETIR